MRTMTWMAMAMAGATALLSLPAQAVPVAGTGDAAASRTNSTVQRIDYRRCWWKDGKRHCRWIESNRRPERSRPYNYNVGEGRPERYPYGSTEWWRAIEREIEMNR